MSYIERTGLRLRERRIKEMALVEVGNVSIVDWATLSSNENRREGVIQRLARIF